MKPAPLSVVAVVFGLSFIMTGLSKSRSLLADGYLSLYAGRLVDTSGIPTVDTLTLEGAGRDWFNQQWLAHWAFYQLYELGGYPLVAIASAALVASGFAILAFFLLQRGVSGFRIMTWALFAYVVASIGTIIRAQSFAYPLFAITLLFLLKPADSPAFRRRTILLLPLLALWANLHGSALLGAGLVCAWGLLQLVLAARARMPRAVAAHAALALLAPVMLLVTPYGTSIVPYYEAVLVNPLIKEFITEWQPASFGSLPSYPPLIFATIVLFVYAWGRGRGVPVSPALTLVTLSLTAVAMLSVRHQAWMGIAGAVLACEILGAADRMRGPQETKSLRLPASSGWVVGGLSTAVTIAVLVLTPTASYLGEAPQRAVDAVAEYASQRPDQRILADESTSAALLWRYPELAGQVAFDPRLELYSQEDLARWFQFVAMVGPDWRGTFEDYDVIAVFRGRKDGLASTGHPVLASQLEDVAKGPDWRQLPSGEDGRVLVRS